jgi:hypothetical protein
MALSHLSSTHANAASPALNWTDTSNNETGFKIERMPAGGSFNLLATVGSNVQAYTDTTVVEGRSYCYRVSAYNSAGTSAPSNSACAQVAVSTSGTTTSTTGASSGSLSGPSTTGSAGVSTGSLGTGSAPNTSYIGSKWKNYKVSVRLETGASGDIGVIFRYLDNNNYYRFVWDADAGQFRLEVRMGGTLKVLATHYGNIKPATFYTIDVDAYGSQISAFIDQNKVVSVTDGTLTEGSVALYTSSNPKGLFDGIRVTDLTTGSVLLKDNFSFGILNGWTIIDEASNGPSIWSVSDYQALWQKSMIGSNSNGESLGTYALYTKGSWTDYQLTLNMKSMDDDTIGVMFRVQDDLNYYRFSWNNRAGFRQLQKIVNGTVTTLAYDTVRYMVGTNYHVTIVAEGGKLQVLVDKQLVFSVIDSTLSAGTVALYSSLNSGADFDNILVEDLRTANILLSDDFNDGDFNGWTILDQTTSNGPSVWTASGGAFAQTTNIGTRDAAESGTIALY